MKTYIVKGAVTISVHTVVEAKSAAEARAIADERPLMGLCNHCASAPDDSEWTTSGELDGEIQDIEVEEA